MSKIFVIESYINKYAPYVSFYALKYVTLKSLVHPVVQEIWMDWVEVYLLILE